MSNFMSELLNRLQPQNNVDKAKKAFEAEKVLFDSLLPNDSQSAAAQEKTPAQLEVEWLQEANTVYNGISNTVAQAGQMLPLTGVYGITSLIEYLQTAIPQLEAFKPKAEILRKAGLNQMSEKLNASLADLQKAYGIYLQMYQGGVQNQIQQANIWNDAANHTTQTILETNRETQEAFDNANKRWKL